MTCDAAVTPSPLPQAPPRSVGLGVHGTGVVLPLLDSANRVEPERTSSTTDQSRPPLSEVRGCVPASKCRRRPHEASPCRPTAVPRGLSQHLAQVKASRRGTVARRSVLRNAHVRVSSRAALSPAESVRWFAKAMHAEGDSSAARSGFVWDRLGATLAWTLHEGRVAWWAAPRPAPPQRLHACIHTIRPATPQPVVSRRTDQ